MWSNSFIQRLIVAETYFLSSIDATEHDIEKFYREACCIAFIETFAGTAECQEIYSSVGFTDGLYIFRCVVGCHVGEIIEYGVEIFSVLGIAGRMFCAFECGA